MTHHCRQSVRGHSAAVRKGELSKAMTTTDTSFLFSWGPILLFWCMRHNGSSQKCLNKMHHLAQNFIISEYALPYKYIITIYLWKVMKRQHINAFVICQFSCFGAMYLGIRFQNTDLNWQMSVMACAQISWRSSRKVVAINLKASTRQSQFDIKCKFSAFWLRFCECIQYLLSRKWHVICDTKTELLAANNKIGYVEILLFCFNFIHFFF